MDGNLMVRQFLSMTTGHKQWLNTRRSKMTKLIETSESEIEVIIFENDTPISQEKIYG